MYLEQLRGLFKSVYLTRAHLRHDDLVWKIPIASNERGPIKSRTMILMRSAGLVYSIFDEMRINRAVRIEIGSLVEECPSCRRDFPTR